MKSRKKQRRSKSPRSVSRSKRIAASAVGRVGTRATLPTSRGVTMQQSYQGPIPPPAMLAAFDDLKPGLAERIIRMAELEGSHSRMVERRALNGAIVVELMGQVFGAGLAILCLWASYELAVAEREWVAAILGGTTMTSVVLAFLRRQRDANGAQREI